jgi:hypothetical protein
MVHHTVPCMDIRVVDCLRYSLSLAMFLTMGPIIGAPLCSKPASFVKNVFPFQSTLTYFTEFFKC